MKRTPTRRALLGAILSGGAGAVAASPVDGILEGVAPLSGGVYRESRTMAGEVESPHGTATLAYDDHGVPHVEADGTAAGYFALGYAQAADRLFQMDLFRRMARGRAAEVLGPFAVGRDVFAAKMDFLGAAEGTRRSLAGTETERLLEAFADGVTAFVENESPGVAFGTLGYDPDPWSVLDSVLVAKAVAWRYTGGFDGPRKAVLRDALGPGTYRRLYERPPDGPPPAIRDGTDGDVRGADSRDGDGAGALDPEFLDWLASFQSPEHLGSNAWVVSGEYTASGKPCLCSDPHIGLRAPPLWYEHHLAAGGTNVRGVTVPGVPFAAIGRNDHGAWGLTALQADVTDVYTYEVEEGGDRYRYRGDWRAFDVETRAIPVRGGDDREVEIKKTVHGPLLEREIDGTTYRAAVAWPGLSHADLMFRGFRGFVESEGIDDYRAACRDLGIALNFAYADRDGHTLYQVVGRIPIRRVDGEVVRGDRVFDGSAGEGEWEGFEPYGDASFDGFVPFEDLPAVVDPDYVATTNQRPVAEPTYPIGPGFSPGFRGQRIYERLDRAADRGAAMDEAFMRSVQLDTVDLVARRFVPAVLDAADRMPAEVDPWLDALDAWDYRMDVDSRGALAFSEAFAEFYEATWRSTFEELDLGRRYWPAPWVATTLPADSDFFDGDRGAVVAEATTRAVGTIEENGWAVYGDANVAEIDHWIGSVVSGFNYPRVAVPGSDYTVRATYGESWGVGYRMIADLGKEDHLAVLAGGNDGSPVSEGYHDQLSAWADGEYRRAGRRPDGDPDVHFGGVDR